MAAQMEASHGLQALQQVGWENKKEAMHLLARLVGNVVREPSNDKYHTLKLDNARLAGKVFSVPGCVEFLEECNFAPYEHALHLEEGNPEHLQARLAELEKFIESETLQQKRRERDARIEKERAADAAPLKLRSRTRTMIADQNVVCKDQEDNSAKWSKSQELKEMLLELQTLAGSSAVSVPRNASIGYLREQAAKTVQRSTLEVYMVLFKDGGSSTKLKWDHQTLQEAGVTDGSTIMLSCGHADEFLNATVGAKKLCGDAYQTNPLYQKVDTMTKDHSWRCTQDVLDEAQRLELMDLARIRSLRRMLHLKDLSMKQVRDEVLATVPAGSLDDVMAKYRNDSRHSTTIVRVTKQLQAEEINKKHAYMYAEDNRKGLTTAIERACKGL